MHALRLFVLPAAFCALTLSGADAVPGADAKAQAPAQPPTNVRVLDDTKPKEQLAPLAPSRDRPAPRTADAESQAAVDAYVKAVGGLEAFAAIQDRYERFNVIRHNPTGETTAVFERYHKRDNMVREDWHMAVPVGDQATLEVLQTYSGKTGEGWTKMMGFVSPLDAKMIYMLVWDKYIDDFFVSWRQDGYALKYRGEGEVQKRMCHTVDVYPPTGGAESRFFFDKETGLLLKKQWRTDGQQGPVRSEVFFGEYRKVKDMKDPDRVIQYPFRQDQHEDGDLIMSREYIEIKLNSGISDEIFGRPDGPIWESPIGRDEKKDKAEEKKGGDAKAPWKKDAKRIVPKGAGDEGAAKDAPKEPGAAPAAPSTQAPAAPSTPAPSAPSAPAGLNVKTN